jgi:SAM-dependent methyltransferase
MSNTVRRMLCFVLLVFGGGTAVAASSTPADVLEAAGVRGGLVVHIGCGDGNFTAALRASDSYIVQGLATDSDAVMAARESLARSGDVTIALFDGKTLPYAGNLVQLVVADRDSKVATDEIMRVLSPRGVVMTRTGGGWKREVKDWPDDIDEWSHHMHGPDNNPVAMDTVVGPPRRLRWKASSLWSRSHEQTSSFAVMVSAGGRNFYIFDDSVPGIIRYEPKADAKKNAWTPGSSYSALRGHAVLPEKWTLFARDAFSGVLLWKRPLKDWGAKHTRTITLRSTSATVQRTLVADGDRYGQRRWHPQHEPCPGVGSRGQSPSQRPDREQDCEGHSHQDSIEPVGGLNEMWAVWYHSHRKFH